MFGGGAPAPGQPQAGLRQMSPPTIRSARSSRRCWAAASRRRPAAEPEPQPAPRPRANPSGRARNPYDDIFGDMFETGRKTRDDYQKGVESIFDQFLKGHGPVPAEVLLASA